MRCVYTGNMTDEHQEEFSVSGEDNTGLASHTTYCYRMRATNAIGSSAYSPTVWWDNPLAARYVAWL